MTAGDDARRQIFDQVGDAVAIIDAREATYPLVSANRACRALLARDERSLVGKPWASVFRQARQHGLLERLRACVANDESFSVAALPYTVGQRACQPWHPGQQTAWDWHVTPLHDDDGQIVRLLIVMTDASARLARDAHADAAHGGEGQAEAGHSDAERDAFLSLISHEIRSPLTSIKGFSQLAAREVRSAGAQARLAGHLRVIEQQTDRIARLVGDLSDAARLHDGRLTLAPVAFDFATRVRAAIEEHEATPHHRPIELTCGDEVLTVHADPERIGQAVLQLLGNAAKYSPERPQINVTIERQGDQVQFAIHDRGIGIPADELPHVFGRFYRASNSIGGGMGLGLFIAHQIVSRSGGTLDVESTVGQGSVFRVTLPLSAAG